MKRITHLLLDVALFLSVVCAVAYLLRIVASWFLPHEWFWGGALTAVAAPVLIALAEFVLARVPATGTPNA